jgi:hypothetical protein
MYLKLLKIFLSKLTIVSFVFLLISPLKLFSIDNIQETKQKIEGLYQNVTSLNRYISRLDESFKVEYPIAIQAGSGDANYAILLDKDKITPKGMYLTAYMRFEIPGTGNIIMFKAEDILLSKTGGLIGDIKLRLVGDQTIPIVKDQVDMVISSADSYVTIDCGGFKNFALAGEIVFSPGVFVAENTNGEQTNDKISSKFSVNMSDWNDMLFDMSIVPFQIKQFPGFGFEIVKAVIDLSDLRNYDGMQFPQRYPFSDEVNGNVNLWQGVYIQKVAVRLPGSLNQGTRGEILANNLLIDDQGFSGAFSATNILTLDKGKLAGWPFSIDNINIELLKGAVTKGSLSGKVVLPISNEKDALSYSALVDANGEFSFTASSPKNIDVSCFMAKMSIDKSSKISIKKVNGSYQASAELNGLISINAKIGAPKETDNPQTTTTDKQDFCLSSLKFQGLTLSTGAPYFNMGTWSLNSIGSDDMTNGFGISLSNINSFDLDGKKGLEFCGMISLMKGSYAAKAVIAVSGQPYNILKSDGTIGRVSWKYAGTEVKEVTLKANDEVISLNGYFAVYNKHAIYGDGISGSITAGVLPKTLGIQVSATAIFGNINNTRYWYFDALVAFKQGVAMGPLALYGFGGGAYYQMRRENAGSDVKIREENATVSASNIGVTASGIKYVPDVNAGFGLKASVIIGLPGNPKTFNGDASFEIAFNSKGGVNTVKFLGNGYVMADMKIGQPREEAQITASLDIVYDFPNSSLHGVLDLKVNAAKGMITGSGKMEMHFDPDKWYIYVGTPQSRVTVTADLAKLAKINTGAYFVVGTVLPPFAELPSKVQSILKLDYKKPGLDNNIQAGKGFAFGMNFDFKTPRLDIAIFYAQFEMGMGFDVMLANYGSNTICVETNQTVGMNGWYAKGQAYAYVDGDIGAKVNFLGTTYSKTILKIAAAVLLQAELPNPAWLKGTVGGEWELFGGVISGNCNFSVELGTKCTMQSKGGGGAGEALSAMSVISALTPENDRTNVDVFTNPQVVFNYKIGTAFEVVDESNKKYSVRITLDHFKITADGKDIAGAYQWNSRNDVYVFTPSEILPGQTKVTLSAKVHFEQNTGSGWQSVIDGGKTVEELLSQVFTTGLAPDYIPDNNVAYMYPMKDQLNFLKGEYSQGYLKLIKGQSYLFELGSEWKQKARYTPVKEGSPITSDLVYKDGFISYNLPQGINNSTIYTLEFVNIPTSTVEIDKNINQKSQEKTEAGEKVTMKTQEAEGSLTVHQEKAIYTSYFRTSMYNYFKDKAASVNTLGSITESMGGGLVNIYAYITINEILDDYEMANSNSIIQLSIDETGYWLKNMVIPIVYYKYPILPLAAINWRNTNILGIIPTKAVEIKTENTGLLNVDEKKSGSLNPRIQKQYVRYKFPYYSQLDFNNITSLLLNGGISNTDVSKYLLFVHPSLILGEYPIFMHYTLPGINKISSSSIMNMEY